MEVLALTTRRTLRALLCLAAALSLLALLGGGPAATPAGAACVSTGWSATGKVGATEKVSPIFWNSGSALATGGQKIQFLVLTEHQFVRQNSNCTSTYMWQGHASQYKLQNCKTDRGIYWCTGWTGWKSFTSGALAACGSHSIQANKHWGCLWGKGYYVSWDR